jgi:TRAP-type C4-dicarboxylate transport system permease small subunit
MVPQPDGEPAALRAFGLALDWCVVLCGALLSLLVFGNVLSRFVFNADVAWSGELASLILVWATFLGGAAAVRRGAHMRVGELVEALSGRVRAAAECLVLLAVMATLGIVAWYGVLLVERTWHQQTTVLYLPVGLLYLAMPVGSALGLPFAFAQAAQRLAELRAG